MGIRIGLLIASVAISGCIDSNGVRIGIGDKKEISTNGVEYTEITCTGISVFWIK